MNDGKKIISFDSSVESVIVTLFDIADALGFCGTVQSPLFAETVYLVMDLTAKEQRHYDFACIAYGDETPFILAEEYVITGLHQDSAEAKTILFHELGHHLTHMLEAKYRTSNDAARIAAVDNGDVAAAEKLADEFAVKYLGVEIVTEGLTALSKRIVDRYANNEEYNEKDVKIAIDEISWRICHLNTMRDNCPNPMN